jgi:hypothetical protein
MAPALQAEMEHTCKKGKNKKIEIEFFRAKKQCIISLVKIMDFGEFFPVVIHFGFSPLFFNFQRAYFLDFTSPIHLQ